MDLPGEMSSPQADALNIESPDKSHDSANIVYYKSEFVFGTGLGGHTITREIRREIRNKNPVKMYQMTK